MRAVTPPRSGARMQRSVAASLAAILELDPGDVPVPDERHPEPWTVWTQWLAQRGLGLVPIAEPKSFNWPGPWLAVLNAPEEDDDVGAVAFGSPPGIAWKPLDGPETFDAVQAGYAIAPADVALWSPSSVPAPPRAGRVEAIVIAPEAEAPMVRVDSAVADSRATDTSKSAARSPTPMAAGTTSHSSKPRCSIASSTRRAGSRRKRPAETCSPAGSTSTRWSASRSPSETSNVSGSGYASRARTSSA